MKKQRLEQLEDISLNRNDLKYQLREINDGLLENIWKDVFKNYIKNKIIDDKINFDEIDNLRFQILKLEWVKVNTDVWIYQMLYNLFLDNILLPSYTEWWVEEDIHKELDSILDRVKWRTEKIFEVMNNNWFFNISLWNFDTIENELEGYDDNGWFIDFRTFDIWWIFGHLRMWLFDEDLKGWYKVKIPIRMPLNTKKKVGDSDLKDKSLSKKEVDIVLDKYFPTKKWGIRTIDTNLLKNYQKKKKLSKEEIKTAQVIEKLEWFNLECKTTNNKDSLYWIDDNSYYLITVSHNNIKELDDTTYTTDEIVEKLELIFNILNLLINDISKKSDIKHNNRFINFATSYFYSSLDDSDNEIDKSTIEKFSKMLIEMNNPVYLDDIWWQKEAKKEIDKIIKSIKYEEIMKSWGARTTTWMIFEWPTWTWKTLLAQAIATEVNAEVYNIKLTDIASSAYINEWANNLKDLFKFLRFKAKKSNKKIIVILDELDALFKTRSWSNQSWEDTKIVNTFLTEMSWFDDINNIIFIWTTNLIKDLDPAVIRSGRLSQTIKVDNPDLEAIEQIFKIHINKAKKKSKKASKAFNWTDLKFLAEKSVWLSWADIEEIIRKVVEKKAIEEIEEWTSTKITKEDFLQSIKKVKKSTKEDKKMWFKV